MHTIHVDKLNCQSPDEYFPLVMSLYCLARIPLLCTILFRGAIITWQPRSTSYVSLDGPLQRRLYILETFAMLISTTQLRRKAARTPEFSQRPLSQKEKMP